MTPLASNLAVTVIDLIPLAIGWMTHPLHDRGMRVFFYFFVVIFLFNVLNISVKLLGYNNLWVLHVYTPIEYGFLSVAMGAWLSDRARKRIVVSILGFVAIGIVLNLSIGDLHHFDSLSFGIESLLLLSIAVIVLAQLLASGRPLQTDHRFFSVMGVVFYFTGTMTLFALRNVFYAWQLHGVVALLASIIWSRAFWCLHYPQK